MIFFCRRCKHCSISSHKRSSFLSSLSLSLTSFFSSPPSLHNFLFYLNCHSSSDEINFVWKVDPLWNRYFKALEAAVTKHGTVPAAQQALEASAAATSTTTAEQADAAPVAAAKEGDGSAAPAPAPQPAAAAGGLLSTVKNMFSAPAPAEEGTPEAATAAGQDTKVAAVDLALKPFNPTDAELLEWIAEQKSIPNIASKTISVEQVEMLQGLPVRICLVVVAVAVV